MMTGAAKRLVLETLGWLLLLAGIAALVLPGPGLLLMVAGLAVLSQQYTWAERALEPVQLRALRAAAEGVETWPRIIASCAGALAVSAVGVVWIVQPDVPGWWPIAERWWLPGGLWTGITMIGSTFIALGLIVYSYRRFHNKPEAVAALDGQISVADDHRFDAFRSGDDDAAPKR